jgi:DNA-binding MarR family transcriptional regulator
MREGTGRAARAKTVWREAREVEKAVEKALGPGTSFIEWLMLETIEELNAADPENISQAAIAERTGANRKTVSYWMQELAELGFVDRGEHTDRRCWSVILSTEGKQKLAWCRQQLEGFPRNR